MPMLIGKGGILLNNRRLIEGEYHLARGTDDRQQPIWAGYIDVTGKSRDGLIEIFTWFEAAPAGLVFAAQNGGTLPVSRLTRDRFDLDAGTARFNIAFARPADE
jgi:hypothetical protein